jgi:hypothetical protein
LLVRFKFLELCGCEVLRSLENVFVYRFSSCNLLFGRFKRLYYLKESSNIIKLKKVQVFQQRKHYKEFILDKRNPILSIEDHPFIPNILFFDNIYHFAVSNLTTSSRNAVFIARSPILHSEKDVFLYNTVKFIGLKDKDMIDRCIMAIKKSKERTELSEIINQDESLLRLIENLVSSNLKELSLEEREFEYFNQGLDITSALEELKKKID